MTIEIINGDLLDAFDKGEVNHIGHVTNCFGVMGSGIAKSVRERYPQVYEAYRELAFEFECGKDLLGVHQPVYLSTLRCVHNLHAQYAFGSVSRDLNYGALAFCLQQMSEEIVTRETIGFPYKLGSDRAKGDWNIVLEMIEFYFKYHNVKIYKL